MALYNCAGGNGGGGGGTSDYAQLSNKPQINNTTLLGNKSAADLGLVGAVSGKGLSSNDYTNADKAIVDGVTSALAGKVDKVTGKGLSSNDYTNADKGIVDGVTSALAGKVDTSLVGSANGIAELDANGRVPSSQLPSYVDDVLEYTDLAHFPATGETGKIYIAEDTNKTYRWSGSDYAEISESLALGETSSTAYAGNKGKANADAIAGIKNGTSINSFGAVETALAGKQDELTFDSAPTASSTNPVTSSGVKTALDTLAGDVGDKTQLNTVDKSSTVAAINELNSGLMSSPTEATKNADYVGDNFVKVLRIGNLVNVSGRFQVTTEKPAGQGNYLFSGMPAPYGEVVSVNSTLDKGFIITSYGVLTSNGVVPTGYYNIQATYSVTN